YQQKAVPLIHLCNYLTASCSIDDMYHSAPLLETSHSQKELREQFKAMTVAANRTNERISNLVKLTGKMSAELKKSTEAQRQSIQVAELRSTLAFAVTLAGTLFKGDPGVMRAATVANFA